MILEVQCIPVVISSVFQVKISFTSGITLGGFHYKVPYITSAKC